MVGRVQTLRSATPGSRPTTASRPAGELYTNWPDRQLGVIDASQAAMDLIGVRFFSNLANYAVGDFVIQGGNLYRAKATVTPAAFNAAQWDKLVIATDTLASAVAKAGDTMTGPLVLPGDPSTALQAATKQYADLKLALAGGTMTGPITLAADPAAALQAATKQYVDSKTSALVKINSGDVTAPVSFVACSFTGYRSYKLRIKHCEPTGTLPKLQARFSKDNGSTWIQSASAYGFAGFWMQGGAAAGAAVGMWSSTGDAIQTQINLHGSPQATQAGNNFGFWDIDIDPGNATSIPGIIFRTVHIQGSGGTCNHASGAALCGTFGPINAIEWFYNNGNVNKSEWELYGLTG